ncbi:MAG: ABC transporter substrate-binding protein, partial [Brevinema sp.]
MKKTLLIMSVISCILFVTACQGGSAKNEVVQWSAAIEPTEGGGPEAKAAFDEWTIANPLPIPMSQDFGPILYRERAQRYFLQGKNGVPDLLEGTLEQYYSFVAAGLTSPIDDLLAKDPDYQYYVPSALEALKVDGKVNAFPSGVSVRALVYRKDLLAKYNLSYPKTWKELVSTAKLLREREKINGFMFTTKTKEVRAFQEFMSFYFTLADNMFEIDGTKISYVAKKDHIQQVLQLYYDLFEDAIDPNERGGDWKVLDYGITGGQAAMVTVGPWIGGHVIDEPNRKPIFDQLGVAPIPVPDNGSPATYMEVKAWVMNPYAPQERREAAYHIIRGLNSSNVNLTYAQRG